VTWILLLLCLVSGGAVGVMVRDRLRLLHRLATVMQAMRDHEAEAAALAADKRVLERDLGVAGRIADWRAFHDDLTALPNRTLLLDRLSGALARRTGRSGAVAVLTCDIDGLRVINDTLGRAAGDAVLREIADRLTATVRPGDTVARVGGDEFVVVAEGFFGDNEATDLVERIRSALAAPYAWGDADPVSLSTSIGIAVADAGSAEDALRDADAALYRAKERGHDHYEFFTAQLRAATVRRLGTEWLLRHALEADGVDVYYQPIVDLATTVPIGGEALLRIRTDDGRLLVPSDFLGVAESTGLIGPLGSVVVAEACRRFEQWRQSNPELSRISINLAGRQLAEPAVVSAIEEAVQAAGLEPHHVCVDVAESALVAGDPDTRAGVDRLTGAGFGLGIDDFGIGSGSLACARSVPADSIKIDRSCVAGLPGSASDRAVVAAVVELARALGLATVAEGVETTEQLEELRRLGCTYGQGFLFSQPVQGDEFAGLLGRSLLPIAA
jgi:diguanylate cyclase (GGDEF)-like protein